MAAKNSSHKNSIVRHMAKIKVSFANWPSVSFKVNEAGEEVEVKKDADQTFSDDLNSKLEHFGALYVKYLRFREKVHLLPLSPDRTVLTALLDL